MPLKVKALDSKLLWVQASGKFSKEDYQHFVPEVERLISKQGKIRILFEMRDFHGWDAGALWEDIKFDFKHFSDIERLAMVGDKTWEVWMAKFCKPFTTATIHYFDLAHTEDAKTWVEAD